MISEGEIETQFDFVKITPNQDEAEKIALNHFIKVDGKKLVFEKSPQVKRSEVEMLKEGLRQKADAGQITSEDLNTLIKSIL